MTYDALHRVETVDNLGTAGLPNIVLTYSYDLVGKLTNVLDNQGINVGLTYDDRDLLVVQSWQGTLRRSSHPGEGEAPRRYPLPHQPLKKLERDE